MLSERTGAQVEVNPSNDMEGSISHRAITELLQLDSGVRNRTGLYFMHNKLKVITG